MFIEYELKGSVDIHKGVFETTGFWVRYELEREKIEYGSGDTQFGPTEGYKIFSHCSFSFFHEEEEIAKGVYTGLLTALSGVDWSCKKGTGYINVVG